MSKPPAKKSPAKAATPAPAAAESSSFKQVLLGWYGVVGMTLGYILPFKFPWAESYAKDYWRAMRWVACCSC